MKQAMTNSLNIDGWKDLPWKQFEGEVFRLQQRIFRKSQVNERHEVHKLQRLLLGSRAAKCLAVRMVAEINKGRATAGVDGVKRLSAAEKYQLAESLDIRQPVAPVRRVWIPKPGKNELRPLGIPSMADRAKQALLAMGLEPEWEARFATGTFGFRKGHSVHDAIATIRSSILRAPKWVLDADIEKFFDRVDHAALLRKLDTFPLMENAVRRILQSGALEGSIFNPSTEGTPQGGPLSPLLANIALCGLQESLSMAFKKWSLRDGSSAGRPPVVVIYADDFVVLHREREIVLRCREWIEEWLRPLGLQLHPRKTRVVHTLIEEAGQVGFDFLGHEIRQHKTGKYAVKAALKRVATIIRPTQTAQAHFYRELVELIDHRLTRRTTKLPDFEVELRLIEEMNRKIRGWSNFYQYCNAKVVFSRIDSLLWWKLRRALVRRHRKRGTQWVTQTLLRNAAGQWQFHCPASEDDAAEVALKRLSDTPIRHYYSVRSGYSIYNGDWPYWATRLGRHPAVPRELARDMRRQAGRCPICQERIEAGQKLKQRFVTREVGDRVAFMSQHVHETCLTPSDARTSALMADG